MFTKHLLYHLTIKAFRARESDSIYRAYETRGMTTPPAENELNCFADTQLVPSVGFEPTHRRFNRTEPYLLGYKGVWDIGFEPMQSTDISRLPYRLANPMYKIEESNP